MKVTVYAKKIDMPEGFEILVNRKLSKYDKYFKDGVEAFVAVSRKRGFATVELTINTSGTIFRSEQSEKTHVSAFDSCIDAIERQIRKNKTRLNKKLREGAFIKGPDSALIQENDYEEEGDFNVRYKSFVFKPMSVEEAILQMNITDHDFFVFKNQETGDVNVVYRKKDGDYGCITPE